MSETAPTSLSLMFNEQEDRLVLLLGADQPGLLLTRRLTARLVNGFASVLEKSRAREEKEAAVRERLNAGELGLDVYAMRDRLAAKGLVYVDQEEDS